MLLQIRFSGGAACAGMSGRKLRRLSPFCFKFTLYKVALLAPEWVALVTPE